MHYDDLQTDLTGEMRRIADFLDIEISDAELAGRWLGQFCIDAQGCGGAHPRDGEELRGWRLTSREQGPIRTLARHLR